MSRASDEGQSVSAFINHVLVRCPRCSGRAVVRSDGIEEQPRLACSGCGFSQEGEAGGYEVGTPHDPYFGIPLWLQTPCCGHILWARNIEHLDWLDRYVSAKLRERYEIPNREGIRNRRMASRLPKWMTSAKNRERVLRAIASLRELGADAPRSDNG